MSTELIESLNDHDMLRLKSTGVMCVVQWTTPRQDGTTVAYVCEVFEPTEHVLTDDSEIQEVFRGQRVDPE